MTSRRKRSRAYYGVLPAKKKRPSRVMELSSGMQGILISTNDQEKLCVSEAYNLLNEYADQLYGTEAVAEAAAEAAAEGMHSERSKVESLVEDDVASAVAREIEVLRRRNVRFQACRTGVKHLVFIQCCESVDPCQLVHHILSDLMKSGVHKARFCQRVIPVTKVCRATLEDIQKEVFEVLEPYFYADNIQSVKFAVHFKSRNNSTIKRETVIHLLASMVTQEGDYPHTVDLNNADLTVVAEVVKNLCCLSVVKDFKRFKNYNIHSVSGSAPEVKQQDISAAAKKDQGTSCTETVPHECVESNVHEEN